jgi:hypothetical protein
MESIVLAIQLIRSWNCGKDGDALELTLVTQKITVGVT